MFRCPSALFQVFLLSFHYDTFVIQVTTPRSAPFHFILLEVLSIISFYVTVPPYVTATIH